MIDVALLVLRVVFGLLLAGHGAQKLFGWFGGHGLQGTAGWLASLGLRPASFWALSAGASEFGGGVLMALGLLHPLGPLAVIAAMVMAIVLAHARNGLWATNGGIELPLANTTVALAVALAGPGGYAFDALFGLALPAGITIAGILLVVLGVAAALLSRRAPEAARAH